MFDQIHSHLVLDFCLLKDFTLQFQLHDLQWVCWYLLFLASSVLEGCPFLRICASLLVVQFTILELPVVMSYEPLCLYSASCHFSFSFLILLIWVLSPFFLDESLWKFTNYLFKEPAFSFIDFFAIVFIPILLQFLWFLSFY